MPAEPLTTCAGCSEPGTQLDGAACERCAARLPTVIRTSLEAARGLYPATYRLDIETAVDWLRRHPWRDSPRRRPRRAVGSRGRATAAARVGLTLEEYDRRRSDGLKWCTGCKDWHSVQAFGSDVSRRDGRAARCDRARGIIRHGTPERQARD